MRAHIDVSTGSILKHAFPKTVLGNGTPLKIPLHFCEGDPFKNHVHFCEGVSSSAWRRDFGPREWGSRASSYRTRAAAQRTALKAKRRVRRRRGRRSDAADTGHGSEPRRHDLHVCQHTAGADTGPAQRREPRPQPYRSSSSAPAPAAPASRTSASMLGLRCFIVEGVCGARAHAAPCGFKVGKPLLRF